MPSLQMDIHGCVACVREHFHKGDPLRYTLPLEAYVLDRALQYRICDAWNRFQGVYALSPRECVLLAEAWLIAAPSHTDPMHVKSGWIAEQEQRGAQTGP